MRRSSSRARAARGVTVGALAVAAAITATAGVGAFHPGKANAQATKNRAQLP